jgi:hypothetical protein
MKTLILIVAAGAAFASPVAAQSYYSAPQAQYQPQQNRNCDGTIQSGVAGATLGASMAGNNSGNKAGGALIGALLGAAVNHAACDREQPRQQYYAPPPQPQYQQSAGYGFQQPQQYSPQPVYQRQPECGMGQIIIRAPDGTTTAIDKQMCMTAQGWKIAQ